MRIATSVAIATGIGRRRMQPQPFEISVSDETLHDLRLRLQRTRWGHRPRDETWKYGTSPEYLRELIAYWRDQYDWRRCEAELNALPQYTVDIDGQRLHFI